MTNLRNKWVCLCGKSENIFVHCTHRNSYAHESFEANQPNHHVKDIFVVIRFNSSLILFFIRFVSMTLTALNYRATAAIADEIQFFWTFQSFFFSCLFVIFGSRQQKWFSSTISSFFVIFCLFWFIFSSKWQGRFILNYHSKDKYEFIREIKISFWAFRFVERFNILVWSLLTVKRHFAEDNKVCVRKWTTNQQSKAKQKRNFSPSFCSSKYHNFSVVFYSIAFNSGFMF